MRKLIRKSALAGMLGAVALLATACPTDPGAPLDTITFSATNVTVNNAQDEIRLFGACIAIPNCNDEPYIINVNFSVNIGQPGSAQTWVTSSRSSNPENVPAGQSRTLTGAAGAPANFSVRGLDVIDLLNPANKLAVFGSYTWAMEEDTVAVNSAANSVASVLKTALNSTLATGSLPSDVNFIIDLIIDSLGSAFNLLLSNIPLFGLGDDVVGGGMYIGVGAKGALADVIQNTAGGASPADFAIPIVSLPPDIQNVGVYTLNGATFSNQVFTCSDCQHTYTFVAG